MLSEHRLQSMQTRRFVCKVLCYDFDVCLGLCGWGKCGKRGVAVKPSVGDALLFWGVLPDTKTIDKVCGVKTPFRQSSFDCDEWLCHATRKCDAVRWLFVFSALSLISLCPSHLWCERWYMHEQASMHAGCPVLRGVKWTATKWIHARPYDNGYGIKKILKWALRQAPTSCKCTRQDIMNFTHDLPWRSWAC